MIKDWKIKHSLWKKNDGRNKYVQYAYNVWWINFVALLEAENWRWAINTRSYVVWINWYYDYGFCQINKWRHKNIVNDPRFFTDWKRQIDKCYELYKWWTTFYGAKNISKTKIRFEIKSV